MSDEEIEELETDEVEVVPVGRMDLWWKCKCCNEENTEYDITLEGYVNCECINCGKKYKYYHCIY